jgi:pimeloyl-ACP methyl ester carboxylesterase
MNLLARSWKWALFVILLFVTAGLAYEQISRARDRRDLIRIGRTIDVGNRALNIYCSGVGRPVVILESGAGMPGYSWVAVQRDVAEFTHACWYDRAGQGWSDPRPEANWSDLAADDLHTLLTRAAIRPPYVLVAHSLGALNARVYQAKYPREVAGMVLLDPADEVTSAGGGSLVNRLPAPVGALLIHMAPMLAEVGVLRLFAPPVGRPPTGISRQEWDRITRLRNQPKGVLADIRGGANAEQDNVQRISSYLVRRVEDIPLKVLQPERASAARKQRVAEQAKRSSRGEHIFVANAGHMLQWDAPDTVVAHVRDLIEQIGR